MKVTKYLRLLAVFDCYIFIYFFLAVTQHSVQLNFIYTASVNIRINKKKNSLSRGRNLQQDKPHMGVGDVLTVIVDWPNCSACFLPCNFPNYSRADQGDCEMEESHLCDFKLMRPRADTQP